jgi:uncharacterized protein (DUF433 family)
MSKTLDTLLDSRPDVRHGRPCVAGTGITVHRVAILHRLGHSPEEIARKYEHLDLAGIHAALAYYHANRAEVDAEIAADEAAAERVESEHLRRQDVA